MKSKSLDPRAMESLRVKTRRGWATLVFALCLAWGLARIEGRPPAIIADIPNLTRSHWIMTVLDIAVGATALVSLALALPDRRHVPTR